MVSQVIEMSDVESDERACNPLLDSVVGPDGKNPAKGRNLNSECRKTRSAANMTAHKRIKNLTQSRFLLPPKTCDR